MQDRQQSIPRQEDNCPPRLDAEAKLLIGSEEGSADVASVNSLQVSEQASASVPYHAVSSTVDYIFAYPGMYLAQWCTELTCSQE